MNYAGDNGGLFEGTTPGCQVPLYVIHMAMLHV